MILGATCAAIKILRIPAIATVVACLVSRKNKWRMRIVKKEVEMTRSSGSELLK